MAELTDCHRARLEQAADVIELMDAKFDMSRWFKSTSDQVPRRELLHDCGTSCCIGGTMGALWFGDRAFDSDLVWQDLPAFLGLSELEARELFTPSGCDPVTDRGYIACQDPRQGAAVLRHLAATGEVDWPGVSADYHALKRYPA